MGDFRNLRAYQLAFELAAELQLVTRAWPAYERWSIGHQLVRAAGSIGANIAEAEGRWHSKDRVRFFVMARGSIFEARHWIYLAAKIGLFVDEPYTEQLDELGRITNGLIRQAQALIANS